jgi:flagellar hook-associated protein 1
MGVSLFNIGRSGMMATKGALNATSHNIANVNTEGYSRQLVEQTAGAIVPGGRVTYGTGAMLKSIKRVNDEYLEKRIQQETKNFGNLEEKDAYLRQTEQIFNESNNDGLNRLSTKLFNDFRQLSGDPQNEAIRSSVRESSNQLIGDFKRMDRSLKDVQANIDARIEGYVRDINALSAEVRDLNVAIQKEEITGASAPDLHDKRDLAMKRLGAMADISVGQDNNGRYTVTLAGQVSLVAGDQTTKLEIFRSPPDPVTGKAEGRLDIAVNEPVPYMLTGKLKTGRLGGLLEVRDQDVGRAQKAIDELAFAISKSVNEVHSQGYGTDGGTGRNFFRSLGGPEGAASLMDLSEDVKNNLAAIATAKEPNAPSDNRIAIALSGLGTTEGLIGERGTISDHYNSMVSEVAVKTGATKRGMIFQKDVLSQVEGVRENMSGVSLDEETANLVRFQHAYAANAKVLQVADETMQTVLNTFR